ncbi:MAG: SIS domain-containing protein [Reichenbachiella sp.]
MERNYEMDYLTSLSQLSQNTECHYNDAKLSISESMCKVVELTQDLQERKGRMFIVGNGASAAFANHMALDWSKNGKVNTYSLSDSALLSALANDFSYESAFEEFLKIEHANSNDIVITVSSSGNSPNIVKTLEYCEENGITTVGFSGLKESNKTRSLATHSLYVPAKTYGMVECIHQILLHMWLDKFMGIYEWDRDTLQNMNDSEFKL